MREPENAVDKELSLFVPFKILYIQIALKFLSLLAGLSNHKNFNFTMRISKKYKASRPFPPTSDAQQSFGEAFELRTPTSDLSDPKAS